MDKYFIKTSPISKNNVKGSAKKGTRLDEFNLLAQAHSEEMLDDASDGLGGRIVPSLSETANLSTDDSYDKKWQIANRLRFVRVRTRWF